MNTGIPGERRVGTSPPPPDGQGPVLEWYRPSIRGFVRTGVWLSLLEVVFGFVRFGLDWIAVWWMWPLVVLPVPVLVQLGRVQQRVVLAAGARWFATGVHAWVRLYELARIDVRSTFRGMVLELTDVRGGQVSVQLLDAQCDRDLWDLVHHGIVHSARNGAKIAPEAARILAALDA